MPLYIQRGRESKCLIVFLEQKNEKKLKSIDWEYLFMMPIYQIIPSN